MLKISIIFWLEIHFVNFNLAPDCRRHKSVSKTIIFAVAVNMLRIYHAYAESALKR